MKKVLPALAISAALAASAHATHIIGYTFEDGPGTTTANTESASFTGTLTNGASFGTPNLSSTTNDSMGTASLALDGTNDYLAIAGGGTALSGASGFSISGYFQLNRIGGNTQSLVFFAKGGGAATNGTARAVVQVLTDGALRIGGRRDDDDLFSGHASAGGLIAANQTYGFAATVDFASGTPVVKMFINGLLVAAPNLTNGGFTAGTAFSSTTGLGGAVGSQTAGAAEWTNGRIDDVKVWDFAISDAAAMANSIPEPSGALLVSISALGLLVRRRRL